MVQVILSETLMAFSRSNNDRYFEDYVEGDVHTFGSIAVEADEMPCGTMISSPVDASQMRAVLSPDASLRYRTAKHRSTSGSVKSRSRGCLVGGPLHPRKPTSDQTLPMSALCPICDLAR
jgi:hypothetical protein